MLDTADIDPFSGALVQLNSDSAIGVNSLDPVRTTGSSFEFVGLVGKLEDAITDVAITGEPFAVGCNEAFVNKLLSILL